MHALILIHASQLSLDYSHKNFLYKYVKECFVISGANTEEKVDVSGEKSAQISIVTKKTVTQRLLQIMIMESKQATHYNYYIIIIIIIIIIFVIMFMLCY